MVEQPDWDIDDNQCETSVVQNGSEVRIGSHHRFALPQFNGGNPSLFVPINPN